MIEFYKDIATWDDMKSYGASYIIRKYDEIKVQKTPYALLHINIKNFRYFNTKFGIETGNQILLLIFQQIVSLLDEGEYAAYLYADNYAVLVHCDDANHLIHSRLMELLDRIYRIENEQIHRNIFYSMGIYQIVDSGVSFQSALNFANLSRKECNSIANRSFCMELYDQNFHDQYMNRMELENDTAEAYKNYEFVTYLQPKVDLKTGQIAGAEALIRWFDQDGNNVPLYKFLPILNQNSYIVLVDMDTFEQVCKCLDQRIRNQQKVVPVSVNISKAYFYRDDMVADYIKVFEKYNIPKHLIEIELMESISLDDTDRMKRVISGFKEYGFTCSLDDFGNGYSSFNVLLNAQLDIIKMDRQFFVNNLNGDSRRIIKTVVDLLHSLNMKIVAEGVETQEHIDWLKECGCDMVQGYYYYKPMPLKEFEDLLDQGGTGR